MIIPINRVPDPIRGLEVIVRQLEPVLRHKSKAVRRQVERQDRKVHVVVILEEMFSSSGGIDLLAFNPQQPDDPEYDENLDLGDGRSGWSDERSDIYRLTLIQREIETAVER